MSGRLTRADTAPLDMSGGLTPFPGAFRLIEALPPRCYAGLNPRRLTMNVSTKPSSTFKLEAVHPDPSQAWKMPYAPAIKIVGVCDLMFLSGATASPLYHHHPHQDHEHVHPHSIEDQTTNAMEAIKSILDSQGCTWRDVIKVTKYLTDFREADAMHKTMAKYFGDWLPASTTVCINQLSSPGARIELDMIVALPKSAGK
jgi:2-iminobutanoate/2-iminopropanoate deaminase